MVNLLHELRHSVTEEDRHKIDSLLGRIADDVSDAVATLGPTQTTDTDEPHGELQAPEEVSSMEEMDFVDEDVVDDNSARATGYVGKSSVIQWLRRLEEELESPKVTFADTRNSNDSANDDRASASPREGSKRSHESPNTSTFYLDADTLVADYSLDAFQLPLRSIAETFVDNYMHVVQASFPVISGPALQRCFQFCYSPSVQGKISPTLRKQLALLNLVFAIEARYSNLIQGDLQADDEEHLIFYSRATILGLDELSSSSNPDLAQIQISALLAFYLLCVGRVNRAWVVMGNALRSAHALGLHVRNEDKNASIEKKETLSRLWLALFTLEESLSTIVGRPSFISNSHCSTTVPLPVAMEQFTDAAMIPEFPSAYKKAGIHQIALRITSTISDHPNSGSYLMATVHLSVITQKLMSELYSAEVVEQSWERVQNKITGLCDELETWLKSLPPVLVFNQPNVDGRFRRERLALEMYYARTKMLITRPCLCKLGNRTGTQSRSSKEFDFAMARACVESAKAMAKALPDRVDAVYLYQNGPWWSLIHNIMQAVIVLLLELSFGAVHLSGDEGDTLRLLKQLMRWLMAMKGSNKVAERGYSSTWEILQKLAPQFNADLSDLLAEHNEGSTIPTAFPFHPHLANGLNISGFTVYASEHLEHGSQESPESGHYGAQTAYAPMFGYPAQQSQQSFSFPIHTSADDSFPLDISQHPAQAGNPAVAAGDVQDASLTLDADMLGSSYSLTAP